MVGERDQAARVTFRPAVVVGIGGMGTTIAVKIKKLVEAELERQVQLQRITDTERLGALRTRFKFIGVDSKIESWSEDLAFIRIGQNPGVGRAMENFFKQDSFTKWWPRDFENPGNFDNGCGHVRYKGRLAHYLATLEGIDVGARVGAAVSQAVQTAGEAPLPGGGAPPVPVFVCASLSGGTGGGNFLAVLQSIKRLHDETQIYGVVIDSSIASFGAYGDEMRDREMANNWAGLIELDAWMEQSGACLKAAHWDPYWPMEEKAGEIKGVRPAADLIWIFHYQNMDGGVPAGQEAAMNQTADAVATWVHSASSDSQWAMDSNIKMQVANMDGQAAGALGRTIRYGSMSIAHLRFSGERVLTFLGSNLGISCAAKLLAPDLEGRDEIVRKVDAFLREHNLVEDGLDQILERLRGLKDDSRDPLPRPPNLEADLVRASASGYASATEAAMVRLEGENGRLKRYREVCDAAVARIILGGSSDDHDGVRHALDDRVRKILTGSPSGLSDAQEFLQTMLARIAADEKASIERELEGDADSDGLVGKLNTHKASMPSLTKDIQSIVPGRTRRNIRSFVEGWWKRYISLTEDTIDRTAATRLYDALDDEIDTLLDALDRVREALKGAVDELRNTETTALPATRSTSERGLIEEVLYEKDDVKEAFKAEEGVEERIARDVLEDEDMGVKAAFRSLLAGIREVHANTRGATNLFQSSRSQAQHSLRAVLYERSSGVFAADVRGCSVWEAVRLETTVKNPGAGQNDFMEAFRRRLEPILAAAQPMFPFEKGALQGRDIKIPQRSLMIVAATDNARRFGGLAFKDEQWLDRLMSDQLLGGGNLSWVETSDHQRISISMQLVGFPLLAFNRATATRSREKFLELMNAGIRVWSDVRAADLPDHFEPIERGTIDYVIALALGWRFIRYKNEGDKRVFVWPEQFQTQVYATGIENVVNRLELNIEEFALLRRQVNEEFGKTANTQWLDRVAEATEFLNAEKLSESSQKSPRWEILDRLLSVANESRTRVGVQYNERDQSTLPVLEQLRPQ